MTLPSALIGADLRPNFFDKHKQWKEDQRRDETLMQVRQRIIHAKGLQSKSSSK